ncbi:MAG: enoyl-CoA hydratase/isomerase family protein [Solirubrobacterales bacterium]
MTTSKTADVRGNPEDPWAYEKLHVRREGTVLFAEIAAPPMNLQGPELVRDLVSLIQRAEAHDVLKVLVFTSADPDYFISHVDVTRIEENRAETAKLVDDASMALLLRHLSASHLVTIAQIEGRVRGVGSEFVLACDMRFAARESRFPAAGQVVVKERVNEIALAPVEDFRRDSELFLEGVRTPESTGLIQAAMKRGFQTRDAEMDLARLVGDLADR